MTTLKKNSIPSIITAPLYIGLIVTMLINGFYLLSGEEAIFSKYINIYNNNPLEHYPSYFITLFYGIGIVQIIVAITLCYALIKKEFLPNRSSSVLKWGILLAIFSVSLFGFMVRIVSNHAGAANLYFYMTFLYFLLWYIEKQSSGSNHRFFDNLKLLPIYFSIFYTMGFPGWQKLINTSEVMGKYIKMFSESFLAKLPGGVQPFIYFLGIMEIIVPVLLIISLIKKEFITGKKSTSLNSALFISISTFVMLSFGLGILINYQGSTNLIFYAVSTFALYLYTSFTSENQ